MLEFSGGLSPAMYLLFLVKSFGILFFSFFSLHLLSTFFILRWIFWLRLVVLKVSASHHLLHLLLLLP